MGVYSYYNVYTAKSYEERVELLTTGAQKLINSGAFDSVKSELDKKILTAMEYEEKICNAFGVKNLDELRERLKEYQSAVINFSGPALNELVNDYKKIADTEVRNFSNIVNYIAETRILPDMNKLLQNNAPETVFKIFKERYFDYLNLGKSSSGKYYSESALVQGINGQITIDVLQLSKAQMKEWKRIIEDLAGSSEEIENAEKLGYKNLKGRARRQWQFRTQISKIKESVNESSFAFDFYAYGGGEKNSKEGFERLKQRIIALADGDAQPLIEDILNHILAKKPDALFIGDNPNQITGILGEIQGMYYMSVLFGGKDTKKVPPEVEWQGGAQIGTNNEKPHIDILINKLIGVQVKNSRKDLERIGDISFREIHLETIFKEVKGLDPDIQDLVTSYFGTKGFNVDYDIEYSSDKTYQFIHGGPIDYGAPTTRYLLSKVILNSASLANNINKLLLICLEAFMYIKTAETTEHIDLNSLYLIGGATLYAVSEILSKLKEELDNEAKSSFSVTSSYNGMTIVESLNHSHKVEGETTSAIRSDLGRGNTKTGLVIANIILSSSFNFGSLL